MTQYIWLLPLGVLVGLFDTRIRAGGGVILTPLLLMVYPAEPPEVIARIALAVLCINAIPGSVRHARRHQIDYRAGVLGALAIMPCAVIGALLSTSMTRRTLALLFGLLLLLTAVCLLGYHRLQPPWPRMRHGQHLRRLIAAEGTLHFTLAVLALTGLLVHLVTGAWHQGLRRTVALALGVLVGAQLGAHGVHWVHGTWSRRLLAVALGVVGVCLLMQACVSP